MPFRKGHTNGGRKAKGAADKSKCYACSVSLTKNENRKFRVIQKKADLPIPMKTWDEFFKGELEWKQGPLCQPCLNKLQLFQSMKTRLLEMQDQLLAELRGQAVHSSTEMPVLENSVSDEPVEALNIPKARETGTTKPEAEEVERSTKTAVRKSGRVKKKTYKKILFDGEHSGSQSALQKESVDASTEEDFSSLVEEMNPRKPRKTPSASISEALKNCSISVSCSLCPGVFKSEANFLAHFRSQHEAPDGSDLYLCLLCQRPFPSRAQAKAHLLECHSVTKEEEAMVDSFLEPITLTLASDDAGFESSVQFSFESDDPSAPDSLMTEKLELKLDADGPSYECPNCNMAFESLDALDEHKREPDQCRIKCRYCDLMFWSRKERVKHHRVHKENANVSCDSCGKFFISAKGLAIHRRRGGCMEERFSCPICHMEFPTVVSRKNHYSTHTRCPECGVENVKNMIDHFRTVHLRQFTCDHCGRTFKTKLIFEQHLARVHKLNGVTERTYQCSGCGKVFTDYSNMKAHFRQFHSSDKNFECQLCGKRTGSQSLLRKHHERVHLHVAKYRCTCCPKVFVYPSQLKKHSRFHTGEMNFPCKYCSKLFRSWENRHEHMLNHLGLQLFRCQICNAQFRRRPLVEKHLSQQHPQYTFEEAVVRNKPFKYLGNGDFTLDEKYQNLLIRQAAASVQPIEELEEDALMSVHPTTTPLEEVTMAEVSGFMGEDGRVYVQVQ